MRRTLAIVGILAGSFGVASNASAAWTGNGSGSGSSKALTMPTGAKPTGSSTTSSVVTLTWSVSTIGTTTLTTYNVTRYGVTGSGTAVSCTAGAPSGGTVSCSYTESTSGNWRWAVTPTLQSWVGTEGTKSDFVTVPAADTVAPIVTITSPTSGQTGVNTAVPASGTFGRLSGDNASVSLEYYAGSTATGNTVGTATATVNQTLGTWSFSGFSGSAKLSQNTQYTLKAIQTDAAGNIGTATVTFKT